MLDISQLRKIFIESKEDDVFDSSTRQLEYINSRLVDSVEQGYCYATINQISSLTVARLREAGFVVTHVPTESHPKAYDVSVV